MKKAILYIIKILISFLPKDGKKIIFRSFPDYSGNSLSLYKYIKKNHTEYNCIWLVDDKINYKYDSAYIKSIKGIYHYLTAKFVVTTHNDLVSISPENQTYISLWHGMPLKKICYLGNEYSLMRSIPAKRISTSELTRSLIASSFNEKANNVYITGQPVCDNLFNLDVDISSFNIPVDCKKIAFYLPTFREDFNEDKVEGRKVSSDNIFRLDNFNHKDFLEYLKINKIFLFIKLHPAEEHVIKDIVLNEYVCFLKSGDIDLYSLLGKTDLLITDYSSVYIDYLLRDKPIAFVIPDEKEYIKSRNGFTLEPYDFWASGEKIHTLEQFYRMMDNFIKGNDSYLNQREIVKNILHTYKDNNNSKRVFDLLIKKK